MQRLVRNEAGATPLRQDTTTAEVVPEETVAEPAGPLQRRGVRISLLLLAFLGIAAVTVPLTSGMTLGEWLKGANPRAAYGADNLRYSQASALIHLGLWSRALDVIDAIPSQSEDREELLAEVFSKTAHASEPDLAIRAIQLSPLNRRGQRSAELAQILKERDGLNGALEQLERPVFAPVRESLLAVLINGLTGADLDRGEHILARISPGATHNQAREILFGLILQAQQLERGIALLDTARTPAERRPMLLQLILAQINARRIDEARRAFDEARAATSTREAQFGLDNAASSLAIAYANQHKMAGAFEMLSVCQDTGLHTMIASAISGALTGTEPAAQIETVLSILAESDRAHPGGGTHDSTLTMLFQKARERNNLAAARAWAEKLTDPTRRAQTLQSLEPPKVR